MLELKVNQMKKQKKTKTNAVFIHIYMIKFLLYNLIRHLKFYLIVNKVIGFYLECFLLL